MTTSSKTLRFPALRCSMGSWIYYVTAMPMGEISTRVQRYSEELYPGRMDDLMQRALAPGLRDIVQYLARQEERFFNAIVVGVVGGEPSWWSVDVKDPRNVGAPQPDLRNTLGVLELSGAERMFAIDGMHRVAAIQSAVKRYSDLAKEEMAVIFIAHRETLEGREKTRRLFVTLNKNAKPVSRGSLVAMDEDDAFALVTRRLMQNYDGLNKREGRDRETKALVQFQSGPEILPANKHSITSIVTLYDITTVISLERGAKKGELRQFRADPTTLDRFYDKNIEFWQTLRSKVEALGYVMGSDPREERASRHRSKEGGHILLRPAGQKAFAKAVQILVTRGASITASTTLLARTQINKLEEAPWPGIMWNPRGKMIAQNGRLHTNLLLYMARQPLDKEGYDIEAEWKSALQGKDTRIEVIPRL